MSRPDAQQSCLAALAELGGAASPAELRARTGLPARTVSDALGKLRADGLVAGNKVRAELTAAGTAEARAYSRAPEGRFEEALEQAFGASPALCAFGRLAADLVVARRLYPRWRPFHPWLAAYGPPQRGKTALAELLARALGLGDEAIVHVPPLAPGAVVGRRIQRPGGGYDFEPAAHLALPFFCLDEVGELEAEMRRAVQVLCHGDAVVRVEGMKVPIAGTVMATWNPRGRVEVFASAYHRRAVTICVEDVRVPELTLRLRHMHQSGEDGTGTLVLDRLSPVADELDEDAFGVLTQVGEALSEKGRSRFELRTLELATLGRAARHGLSAGADLRALAYFVGADYLTTTETVPGLVEDGWDLSLDSLATELGDAPGFEEMAAACLRRIEARAETSVAVVAARRVAVEEDLELTGARAGFVEATNQATAAVSRVPPANRVAAAALRAKLTQLRKAAGETRSMAGLVRVVELGKPVIEEAQHLRWTIDHEKARAEAEHRHEHQEQLQAAREQRRFDAAVRKQRNEDDRARKKHVGGLLRERRELVKLATRSDTGRRAPPHQLLAARGLLRPESAVEEIEVPDLIRAVPRRLRWRELERRTRVLERHYLVDAAGRRWRESDLASWRSAAVVEVLGDRLTAIDAELDYLGAEVPAESAIARANPPARISGARRQAELPPGASSSPAVLGWPW